MDIKEVRAKTIAMADVVQEILELVEKGFMENKQEFLDRAMAKENELNATEKLLINHGAVEDVLR